MKLPILVVNGPNLNLLGTREPGLYGSETLADAEALAAATARRHGFEIETFQSSSEGAIVDRLHAARGAVTGVVLNAGAYTHTSVAIRDAILATELVMVEVHVSNVHRREPFRQHSYLSDIALAVIVGAGIAGYGYAVDVLARAAVPR
ncbi:type II 3-dehydroquinate dehydratase [Rathayibacter iranicus]|uniref:3-dehydroquinate dehydratase n=2 Tax=Rathayibacter iranicus TaxID=59737 RepID=A0AAD1EM84_9MICO|nr:type II 3-dehydroquinate dehydratase [Rathayibacter iranicus]AZZ55846.1 type II 3-dehydroquinate dehydratase [Rathayibacter iranicus]MWV30718.1 type II 3-dehydroquinate dehydratase [Rathayibacter iranicus NCPPB 2253 = VKM Ac-1602]PPI47615.1 type II 3-dehydroquinate dehydratase [Rathayibacter iranicus]PPI60214.1 type II 3-dehydroquinate dehydratase [Rathayibacter iranicus]PPI71859.1 type II 3-dehydroquinate dehydratase [Rathayibacter iranicus]